MKYALKPSWCHTKIQVIPRLCQIALEAQVVDLNLGMSHPRFQAMYPINSTGRTNGLGSRLGAIIKRIRLLMGYNQDIGLGPDISIKGTRIRV